MTPTHQTQISNEMFTICDRMMSYYTVSSSLRSVSMILSIHSLRKTTCSFTLNMQRNRCLFVVWDSVSYIVSNCLLGNVPMLFKEFDYFRHKCANGGFRMPPGFLAWSTYSLVHEYVSFTFYVCTTQLQVCSKQRSIFHCENNNY